MLVWFAKSVRLRSAGFFAALYLICVLAPSAVFAFGDASQTAHCLTDTALSAHVHMKSDGAASHSHAHGTPAHAHGTTADHDDGDNGAKPSHANCCGLFCLSSLPAGFLAIEPGAAPASVAIFAIAQEMAGSGPDRLYRPPIISLSI
jgi:hypothetical protein